MDNNTIEPTQEALKECNLFYTIGPDEEHLIVEFLDLDVMFDFIKEYNLRSYNIFINCKALDGVFKCRIRFIIKNNVLDYDYINRHYNVIKETN